MLNHRRAFLLTLLAVAGACRSPVGPSDDELDRLAAETLWVPAGAVPEEAATRDAMIAAGRSLYTRGKRDVTLTVTADREDISAALEAHFADRGWAQRPTQLLNPQIPTSFASGWQSRCGCLIVTDADGNVIPREPWHEWHGEWENARGDIVYYSIGGSGRLLGGYGALLSREDARSLARRAQPGRNQRRSVT
jgi:hypothetical protein